MGQAHASEGAVIAMVKRPEKTHRSAASFGWGELEDYIREKHGRDLRDWNGKYSRAAHRDLDHDHDGEIAYLDIWHWICDHHEIHNGSFFTLDLRDRPRSTGNDGNAPRSPRCRCSYCLKSDAPEGKEGWAQHQAAFVAEVFKLLDAEFPEENGKLHVYVKW